MARGVNTGRGVKRGRKRAGATRKPVGYIEYLKGMTGKNKSRPLTPEQWKKQQGRL